MYNVPFDVQNKVFRDIPDATRGYISSITNVAIYMLVQKTNYSVGCLFIEEKKSQGISDCRAPGGPHCRFVIYVQGKHPMKLR
jgi:hypothetical protein